MTTGSIDVCRDYLSFVEWELWSFWRVWCEPDPVSQCSWPKHRFTSLGPSRCVQVPRASSYSLLEVLSMNFNHPHITHLRACYILAYCTRSLHTAQRVCPSQSSPAEALSCLAKVLRYTSSPSLTRHWDPYARSYFHVIVDNDMW